MNLNPFFKPRFKGKKILLNRAPGVLDGAAVAVGVPVGGGLAAAAAVAVEDFEGDLESAGPGQRAVLEFTQAVLLGESEGGNNCQSFILQEVSNQTRIITMYRVSQQVSDLGCVDLDLGCSTTLLGQ